MLRPGCTQASKLDLRVCARSRWAALRVVLAIFLVCVAPFLIARVLYFTWRPAHLSVHGILVEPQRRLPEDWVVHDQKQQPIAMHSFVGKWVLMSVDSGDCEQPCVTKLYYMRQIQAAQGPQRHRLQIVHLAPSFLPAALQPLYPQVQQLRTDLKPLEAWLSGMVPEDNLFLVDPLGHLMMRFPSHLDPGKINRDIEKLLRYSQIG